MACYIKLKFQSQNNMWNYTNICKTTIGVCDTKLCLTFTENKKKFERSLVLFTYFSLVAMEIVTDICDLLLKFLYKVRHWCYWDLHVEKTPANERCGTFCIYDIPVICHQGHHFWCKHCHYQQIPVAATFCFPSISSSKWITQTFYWSLLDFLWKLCIIRCHKNSYSNTGSKSNYNHFTWRQFNGCVIKTKEPWS